MPLPRKLFLLIILSAHCSLYIADCYAQVPLVHVTGGKNPLCDSTKLNWATWNSVTSYTAKGTISSNLKITVNMSTGGLFTTSQMFNPTLFPPVYKVPIYKTSIANSLAGVFKFCFSKPVFDPQIAISSIGSSITVPIVTSSCYTIIWKGQGVTYPNDTTIVGTEGYTIVKFPGVHTCISFKYLTSEYYCNLAFGVLDTNCQQIAPTAVCAGNSVTLTAVGAKTYSWSPSDGLNTTTGAVVKATPSVTTKYFVTGTGVNNPCSNIDNNRSATDSIIVTVNPNPSVTATPNQTTICAGNSVSLTANGANSYTWSPAAGLNQTTVANVTANPKSTTTYTVNGTLNGCSDTANVIVNVNPLPAPSITVSGSNPFCTGESLNLGTNAAYSSYQWMQGGINIDGKTNSTFSITSGGTYNVVVTDKNGCRNSDTVNITQYPVPGLNLGKDTTVCPGTELILNPHNDTVSYTWNDNSHNKSIKVKKAGTYSITITDNAGCKNSDAIHISQFTVTDVNLGKDKSICPGAEITLNPNYNYNNYSWNDNSHKSTLTVNKSGLYSVTVTDKNGCKNSDTIIISQYPLPQIDLGNDTGICPRTDLILNSHNVYADYTWNDNSHNSTLEINKAGKYSLTVTDNNGCTNSDSITIFQYPLPYVNLGNDTSICADSYLILNPHDKSVSYKWNDNSHNSTLEVNQPGIYSVTVTDKNGCTNSDTINVSHYQVIDVNLGHDTTLCVGCSILLNAGSIYSEYQWQDGTMSSEYEVKKSGTYWVNVTDQWGCKYSDTIIVKQVCEDKDLYIPNSFTPNGDNINDSFRIIVPGCFINVKMKIYNRWGNLLYETNEPEKGWNGRSKNRDVSEGVYIYIITYYNLSRNPSVLRNRNGTVTLLR
jgi:gliding motility-associated-like protein